MPESCARSPPWWRRTASLRSAPARSAWRSRRRPRRISVGNARLKALAAARASGLPSLADDSGFCVAALGGAPGVVSARWAGAARDFGAAMARVRREVGEAADRRAWFVCALCLGWPDGQTDSFFARVDGGLAWPPRGENGFGYDPIFVPAGCTLTFGEMTHEAKEAISHRARAFAQFAAACLGQPASR